MQEISKLGRLGAVIFAMSGCVGDASQVDGDANETGSIEGATPALVHAAFDRGAVVLELDRALGAAGLEDFPVELQELLVRPDGSVEHVLVPSQANLLDDGRTVELIPDTPAVWGRTYTIVAGHDQETLLGEVEADDPEQVRAVEGGYRKGIGSIGSIGGIGGGSIDWTRILNTNTNNFLAKETTPSTEPSAPGMLSRGEQVDASGMQLPMTDSITVYFGARGKDEPTNRNEMIDCSWLPHGDRNGQPETDRNVFRISVTRPGSGAGQLMYSDERAQNELDWFYRGSVSCDSHTNSLTFQLPGRLLGAGVVKLYAVARSLGGYYAEREFEFRVADPRVTIDLTKVRNETTKTCDGALGGYKGYRKCDPYVVAAAAVDGSEFAVGPVEDGFGFGGGKFGHWNNLNWYEERIPGSTEVYEGPVGAGVELGLAAFDHDNTDAAAVASVVWQVSSAIFCAAYEGCPTELIGALAPMHEMVTAKVVQAGNDDPMGGRTLVLRRYGQESSPLVGANWGLDYQTGVTWDWRYGYYVDLGRVGVWLKFRETNPSWVGPRTLI